MSRTVKKTPHSPVIRNGSAHLPSVVKLFHLNDIYSTSREKSQLVLIGGPQGEARFMTILVGDVSTKAR